MNNDELVMLDLRMNFPLILDDNGRSMDFGLMCNLNSTNNHYFGVQEMLGSCSHNS
jgi:hypothetical protein